MSGFMGRLWGFVPAGATQRPAFEVVLAHRLRIAVAALVLRAWARQGFAFVRLVEVTGAGPWQRAVLVAHPVRACAVLDASGARCRAPIAAAVAGVPAMFCAEHESRLGHLDHDVPKGAFVVERATWPLDSDEARQLVAMTIALGARYPEAPDPIGTGPEMAQRLAGLRAQLEAVAAARAEVP